MSPSRDGIPGKGWVPFLAIALLLAAALRLTFPGDIEYKADEKWMFEASQAIVKTGAWPMVGMTSGVGIPNPGLSVWVFGALAKVTGATTPIQLARAVQGLNLLALAALVFFAMRVIAAPERLPWLWAAAFACVNPFAVLFHRKIWAQCTLPFFCVLFWMAWHYRDRRTGAFFWGLLGILMGQIHMSGFFLAAGVFLWTVYRDRKSPTPSWYFGTLLGALPLAPWVGTLAAQGPGVHDWSTLLRVPKLKFWEFWATDSLGMGLTYTLTKEHLRDLMGYPLVGGHATYLVGAANLVILLAAVWVLVSFFLFTVKERGSWLTFPEWPESRMAMLSVMVGSGVLMTLPVVDMCRHYLIMSFPLEWVWLARLGLCDAKWGGKKLAAIWAAQLVISVFFLLYLHANQGDPAGGYGTAYHFQMSWWPGQ